MTPLMHIQTGSSLVIAELTGVPRNMVALHRHQLRQRNLVAITTFWVVPLQCLRVLKITRREVVLPARQALLQRSKRKE